MGTCLIKRSLVLKTCCLLVFSAFLPGCDLYEEGHLTQNRLQVHEERYVEEKPLSEIDEGYVAALGQYYNRHGDGPIDLTVVYDPASRVNTAMNASQAVSNIVRAFRKNGMKDVKANVIPVHDTGDEAKVVVSFSSYEAHPPKDCSLIAGTEDRKVDVDMEYKYGCTVDTVFARQIARPKDLKGQGGQNDPDTDGRRASNIVERYRTGNPNEALEGETASE